MPFGRLAGAALHHSETRSFSTTRMGHSAVESALRPAGKLISHGRAIDVEQIHLPLPEKQTAIQFHSTGGPQLAFRSGR